MSFAAKLLKYSGICFCSARCGLPNGPHGWAYRTFGLVSFGLANLVTLQTCLTFAFEANTFLQRIDAFINMFSLLTTWVYLVVWRSRAADLHRLLHRHSRFLGEYLRYADDDQRVLLGRGLRYDKIFTIYMYAALTCIKVLVLLHSVQTGLLALPAFPLRAYDPDAGTPLSPEVFAAYTTFYAVALPCCGWPFAGISSVHVGLNIHAIYLMKCIKLSLRKLKLDSQLSQPAPVDTIVRHHQYTMGLIRDANKIFADAIMERLVITYASIGVTVYVFSENPFGNPKVPFIAFFTVASLVQFAVLSDILRDHSDSVSRSVWLSDWLAGNRSAKRTLIVLMSRAQRSHQDGVIATGMQECLGAATVRQVMQSSVSLLQALRSIQFHASGEK